MSNEHKHRYYCTTCNKRRYEEKMTLVDGHMFCKSPYYGDPTSQCVKTYLQEKIKKQHDELIRYKRLAVENNVSPG